MFTQQQCSTRTAKKTGSSGKRVPEQSLKTKNGHGKVRPCCLTPIEHCGKGPSHVHIDTVPSYSEVLVSRMNLQIERLSPFMSPTTSPGLLTGAPNSTREASGCPAIHFLRGRKRVLKLKKTVSLTFRLIVRFKMVKFLQPSVLFRKFSGQNPTRKCGSDVYRTT